MSQIEIRKRVLLNSILNPRILLPIIISYVWRTKVMHIWKTDFILTISLIIQPTHRIQNRYMISISMLLTLLLLQMLAVIGRIMVFQDLSFAYQGCSIIEWYPTKSKIEKSVRNLTNPPEVLTKSSEMTT